MMVLVLEGDTSMIRCQVPMEKSVSSEIRNAYVVQHVGFPREST
jgi:hypothetical protein